MPTTITLPRYQVRELASAIKALDGRPEVAKDGDGKQLGIVVKPFDIGAKARYAFGKTLHLIQSEVSAFEGAQKALVRQVYGDDVPKDGLGKCDAELRLLGNGETEIEVHKVQVAELKIETNQIPPAVIAALLPILDGEP